MYLLFSLMLLAFHLLFQFQPLPHFVCVLIYYLKNDCYNLFTFRLLIFIGSGAIKL